MLIELLRSNQYAYSILHVWSNLFWFSVCQARLSLELFSEITNWGDLHDMSNLAVNLWNFSYKNLDNKLATRAYQSLQYRSRMNPVFQELAAKIPAPWYLLSTCIASRFPLISLLHVFENTIVELQIKPLTLRNTLIL